jgi:integrase
VDLEVGSIRITRSLTVTEHGFEMGEPKTSASRRTIPIDKSATAALRRHRAAQELERRIAGAAWHRGELVFSDEIGRPLNPQQMAHHFRRSWSARVCHESESTTCATRPRHCCSRPG